MRQVTIAATCLLLLAACEDSTEQTSPSPWTCETEEVAPHPANSAYLGVHANPQNNDFVGCETAGNWEQSWQSLQGKGIAQPNTFSPDGETTYATTSGAEEDACTIYALAVDTGATQWCVAAPGALGGSVAVDAEGDLFVSTLEGVLSLNPDGEERWRREYTTPTGGPGGPTGVHLHPSGHLAFATGSGIFALLDRATGEDVATLSVYDDVGLPRVERPGLELDFEALLPTEIADDFVEIFGEVDQLLAIFAGVGEQWTDNTVGIGLDGALYALGTGVDAATGALVQVRVEDEDGDLSLVAGWTADFNGSSASSPSISPDGRYLKLTDGNSTNGLLAPDSVQANALIYDIEACNENTDYNADAAKCAPMMTVPLLAGPALGASPILNGLEHYVWEVQFANLLNAEHPDIIRYDGDEVAWQTELPDDAAWTSVLTISDNHIIGTQTRFTDSGEDLLTINLPATADSELVVLNRATGEVIFTAPTTDDATSTVTIGPDGSLYVTQLGLLSGFALDTLITGGIIRFEPVSE